ncbi:MAG: sigma-70 family RNA polymerase sigma factor [Planctomycetales bacterium]|nr:sigma-70 family RNA polymerase sigma factor [Planctomycetales bacterium]
MSEAPKPGSSLSSDVDSSQYHTSESLLIGLRDPAQRARYEASWRRFNEKYSRLIYSWFRRTVRHDLAEELTQELMVKLVRSVQSFVYDPNRRFRGWLRTAARTALVDFQTSRAAKMQTGVADDQVVTNDNLLQEMDQELDRDEFMERLWSLVEAETSGRDCEVFRMLTEDGLAPADVAQRFDMKVGTVYMVKSRVMQKLKQVAEGMRKDDTADPS